MKEKSFKLERTSKKFFKKGMVIFMQDNNRPLDNKNDKAKKSAGNNQWSGKSLKANSPERRDGPGGEDKK